MINKNANFTASACQAYNCDTTSADVVATLPDATTCVDQGVMVYNGAGGNNVILTPSGVQAIRGLSSLKVVSKKQILLLSDGSNWLIKNGFDDLVASGTTTVSAGAMGTLGTFTANADEVFVVRTFPTDAVAGIGFGDASSFFLTDYIVCYFKRTANANEFQLVAKNGNAISSRTVRWKVLKS